MKKLLLMAFLCTNLMGCSFTNDTLLLTNENIENNSNTETVENNEFLYVKDIICIKKSGLAGDIGTYFYLYQDAVTGVQYILYIDNLGDAGGAAMCPRYNADGTLYIEEGFGEK